MKQTCNRTLIIIRPPLENEREKSGIGIYADNLAEVADFIGLEYRAIIQKTKGSVIRFLIDALIRPFFDIMQSDSPNTTFHAIDDYGGVFFPFIRGNKIVTIHHVLEKSEFASSLRYYLYRAMSIVSVTRADKVIAISSQTKKEIISKYHISPDKVVVIKNAIQPEYRVLPDVDPRKTIFAIGQLIERKNFLSTLRVFKKIKENDSTNDCNLVICGEGPEKEKLLNYIYENNLLDSVEIVNKLTKDEIIRMYNSSRITMITSSKEGFGLVFLEAQLCGSTTLSFRNAEIPEEVLFNTILCDNEDDMVEKAIAVLTKEEKEIRGLGDDFIAKHNEHFKEAMASLYSFDNIIGE